MNIGLNVTFSKHYFFTTCILLLSGCDTQPTTDVFAAVDLFADYRASLDDGLLIQTSDMPVSGTASYVGPIGIYNITDAGHGAFGELSLDADFGANVITGSASDFVSVQMLSDDSLTVGLGVSGTLVVYNGEITDNHFLAGLKGNLMGVGGSQYAPQTNIQATIGGYFVTGDGSGADAIVGLGDGTATSTNGTSIISIVFVAE